MKPLVLWCRWHEARLRLHGRSAEEVWGELAFADHTTSFRYRLPTRTLTRDAGDGPMVTRLDEMGVEIETGENGP